MKNVWGIMVLCAFAPLATGCGTIVNGSKQDLTVTSTPGGSTVSIDGVPSGTTPIVVPVRRSHAHVVKVEQAGYSPVEVSVVPVTSQWEWFNVFNGFIIGVSIDAWTGGMYVLSNEEVNVEFLMLPNKSTASAAGASPTSSVYK
jgi:hypothetical protein